MTAPRPAGDGACECGHDETDHGLHFGCIFCRCEQMTAAEPAPTTDQALTLNGHEVPVVVEPDLEWQGTTTWTPGYDGRARPPLRIRLRQPYELDGRVLLHEVLHALIGTDPQRVLPVEDPRHEPFVRMLTAGLHDVAGYRRPPTPDAGVSTLGRRIAERRGTRSQAWLAERCGVTQTAVSYWEADKRSPALEMVSTLATALECDPAWLAFGTTPQVSRPAPPTDGLREDAISVVLDAWRALVGTETYLQVSERFVDAVLALPGIQRLIAWALDGGDR